MVIFMGCYGKLFFIFCLFVLLIPVCFASDDVDLNNTLSIYEVNDYVLGEDEGYNHIYVNASASEAGDGSKESPYKELSSVYPGFEKNTVVHIADGYYKYNYNNSGQIINLMQITSNVKFIGEQQANIINVLPSIVENHDLIKYYKNTSQFTFRLLDNQGNPVGAGVSATITINSVFYTRTTDANGYITLNINLNPRTYIATIVYNGLSLANTIKVLPILEAKDLRMKYRDGTKFEVKLLDGQGKPYTGQTITLNINGVFYDRITDNAGIARLNINLMLGEYIITSMYKNGAAISNKITISG